MGWVKRFIFVSLGEVVDWQYFIMEVGAMKEINWCKGCRELQIRANFWWWNWRNNWFGWFSWRRCFFCMGRQTAIPKC